MSRRSSPMPRTRAEALLRGLALVGALLGAGCARKAERSFPGATTENLWRATKGVAEHPRYTDGWTVTRNDFAVDEPKRRLELDREIKRTFSPPGEEEQREAESWRLTLSVMDGPEGPMLAIRPWRHASDGDFGEESARLFAQVAARLRNLPRERPLVTPARAPEPDTPPEALVAP